MCLFSDSDIFEEGFPPNLFDKLRFSPKFRSTNTNIQKKTVLDFAALKIVI